MICVFPPDAVDFSTNGLGAIDPHACTVTETLNGEWELTLEHMIDDTGKWARLAEGNILRAPVPAAMTPRTATIGAPGSSTEIWKITGGNVRLRAGAGTSHKRLKTYKLNDEMIVVDKSNASWYECIAPDGKRGFMATSYLAYVRTETVAAAVTQVIEPKQMRDQPFRIYRIVPEMDKVKVYARHIFYDLLDNMIQSYKPASSATGAQVLAGIASNCLSAHDFTFASDLTATAEDAEFENVNPVEAILGADGLIEKYGGELARDWCDVYVVERVGADAGVQVREGKNLLGISYDLDLTDVITRIMPTGTDKDGKALYLPEVYIDSPNIGEYTSPKWIHMPVAEAQETTTGDDKKTKEQCYTIMRDAVAAEYENGCDLPTITLKVDFINCADTEEYKQYAALQNIYIGDGVRVLARRVGIAVTMRMTQYKFDCLTRKYTDMTLGTVADTIEGNVITARQLPNGVIRGGMIARGSVGAGQLIDGSIGSLKIGLAAIDYAHIQQATINTLMANSITALTAKIDEIVAGTITTDALYAALADVVVLRFGQAVGGSVETDALRALYADLLHGEIGTANIGFGQVKDLITDTAIITEGVGGRIFISRLNVTEANIVRLTLGELMLKGDGGKFYRLHADGSGGVTTTEVQVEGVNVANNTIPGGKLIENTITAREISVESLFADTVLARKITTAMLGVGAVEAVNVKAGAIQATHLSAATITSLGNTLNLTANESLLLAVGAISVGSRNYIPYSDFSTDQSEYWSVWGTTTLGYAPPGTYPGSHSFSIPAGATGARGLLTPIFTGIGEVEGEEVTLSFHARCSGASGQLNLNYIYIMATDGGGNVRIPASLGPISLPRAATPYSVTFAIPRIFTGGIRILIGTDQSYSAAALMYISDVKLEKGNKATDWSPNPEDPVKAVRDGSWLRMDRGGTIFRTPVFEIEVPELDVNGNPTDQTQMQVDRDGVTADTINSPSVAARYNGSAAISVKSDGSGDYRSLRDALAELNDRQIDRNITINVQAGAKLYELVDVKGLFGSGGLIINGNGATIVGRIHIVESGVRVTINNLHVAYNQTSGNALSVRTCQYVRLSGCKIDGNQTAALAVAAFEGANLSMSSCEVYNAPQLIYANKSASLTLENLRGGHVGTTNFNAFRALLGSVVQCAGTIPSGNISKSPNAILNIDGTTVDSGSAPSPEPAVNDANFVATASGSYQVSWLGDNNDIYQGYTQHGELTGAFWFNNTALRSALSGKTILSASLTVRRTTGGRSSATSLHLRGITNASASGSPSRNKDYGVIGGVSPNQTREFDIPVAAMNDLISGAINGLAFHVADGSLMSGRTFSKNYCRLSGVGASGPAIKVNYR